MISRLLQFAPEPRPRVGDAAYLYRPDGLLTVVPPPRGPLRVAAEFLGIKSRQYYIRFGVVTDTSMFDSTGMCWVLEV